MKPHEVIEKLKAKGIRISRATLSNWEKWGLIPASTPINGRDVAYPREAVAHAYASWALLHGNPFPGVSFTPEKVAQIRMNALTGTNEEITFFNGDPVKLVDKAFSAYWDKTKEINDFE
ncbi:hypothetical protein [Heliophilum fasciatum]|uniref:MerR-like DNA binding protein n=1 Tax=Heliophilum fasciatum TaxID=35700 RepID=A0A4R2RPV0_9FIRM|nr:hypothetical protein [Heliophilum fasciatum]MCW2277756.1 hypothetical protein [Heliophilum fasciatum]TCP64749.1 hypothetical protein EDD73_108102 [Heliophilum fasciatum]